MNELKQYAQDRMKEFTSLRKPSSYDESFYGKIKDAKDLEEQFRYTENFISSCEREGNAGRLPDYDEQNLAVYTAYVALNKAARCMSDVSFLHSEFDSITQEQFDSWCEKLHDLIKRKGEQTSRYASRPDM